MTANTRFNDGSCESGLGKICMARLCSGAASAPKVCNVKGRGKVDDNTYEEDDGEFIYQMQMTPTTSWAEGVLKCRTAGFDHLATFDTEAKRQFYIGMLGRSGHKGTSANWWEPQLWTSYNNRNGSGYVWEATGSTTWQSSWWNSGQPDGDGTCGSIGQFGTYNDAPCAFNTGRVCQKPCN